MCFKTLRALLLILLAAGTTTRSHGQEGVVDGDVPPDLTRTVPEIRPDDIRLHLKYLASERLEGRATGTAGERLATDYAARVFSCLGLEPAGDDGGYFQPFEFTAGVSLGPANRLCIVHTGVPQPDCCPVNQAWRPIAFSKTGSFDAPVVFAGYGVVAPAQDGQGEYDSYTHLDVKGKWVVMFRYVPEHVTGERRIYLMQYAGLRYKAMLARDRGALGIVVMSGPASQARDPLVNLSFDASFSGSSIAAVSVSDTVGEALLSTGGRTLESLQAELDGGDPVPGFQPPDVRLQARIDIVQERRTGRNVIGRLPAGPGGGDSVVVVGAHIDHLGRGAGTGSLAKDFEKGRIHYGADDNASGVAGLFEIAQYLSVEKAQGRFPARRDILFAAWSGEELGLLGSSHFAKTYKGMPESEPLSPAIAANVNMDMIGRLRSALIVGGVGSSSIWREAIKAWNAKVPELTITAQDDDYLPTDATSFFVRGVPFINAFTGAHEEYHTPRDTPEKINYDGAAEVARFMAQAAKALAERADPPDFIAAAKPPSNTSASGLRVYLGTIPDYASDDGQGLKLSGVAEGGPAALAGVKGGDVVVNLAGKKIDNIYDYTYAIGALKIGEPVPITVLRSGQTLTLTVTPASRD